MHDHGASHFSVLYVYTITYWYLVVYDGAFAWYGIDVLSFVWYGMVRGIERYI